MRSTKVAINQAVSILQHGGVVAIPTETVYGLAAGIQFPDAVEQVFRLKGRPQNNPLIVHVAASNSTQDLSWLQGELTECSPLELDVAQQLTRSFWPGALTIVLPASKKVHTGVTGGLNTVALRMPAHPTAQQILCETGFPLAAPSANLSGNPSPTCAEHVLADFPEHVPVVDGGNCEVGLESTVVRVHENRVVLLRPGTITREQLAATITVPIVDSYAHEEIQSPGTRYRHYAPKATVQLFTTEEALLNYLKTATTPENIMVLSGSPLQISHTLVTPHNLYALLRLADDNGMSEILVLCTPEVQNNEAIMNRLLKAAEVEPKGWQQR